MTTDHLLTILGMHDAGKSTFIGRLWLAVHSKRGQLQSAGLPEELLPLKNLSDYLNRNRYPEHTMKGEPTPFSVPLQWLSVHGNVLFKLAFADYSGEELNSIFSKRDIAWSPAWRARAAGSFGLMLFLKPQRIKQPRSSRLLAPPSDEEARLWSAVTGNVSAELLQTSRPADDPSNFFDVALLPDEKEQRRPQPGQQVDPPTAVAMVEVLQFLRHERGLAMGELPDPTHFRVAAVVSCWDVVSKSEKWKQSGPAIFLQEHYPLISDFLSTNFKPESVRIFGLSSTGGDLNDDDFKQLYAKSEPEDMGEIVYHPIHGGSPLTNRDITLPIGWLLEGEDALADR